MEHTTGWRNAHTNLDLSDKTSRQMIIYVINRAPQVRDPGVISEYLNFRYLVLGRTSEAITSEGYNKSVQRHMLDQCHITNQHRWFRPTT